MTAALAGTPLVVWALLAYVIWAGLRATRPRSATPAGIAVLPAVFLALSAWSILGAADTPPDAAPPWGLGLLAGVGLGWVGARRAGGTYEEGRFRLPGTWTVLGASLAFFVVQYALGYLRATDPAILRTSPLVVLAPFASGLTAGFPAGRALCLLRLIRGGSTAPDNPMGQPSKRRKG